MEVGSSFEWTGNESIWRSCRWTRQDSRFKVSSFDGFVLHTAGMVLVASAPFNNSGRSP